MGAVVHQMGNCRAHPEMRLEFCYFLQFGRISGVDALLSRMAFLLKSESSITVQLLKKYAYGIAHTNS